MKWAGIISMLLAGFHPTVFAGVDDALDQFHDMIGGNSPDGALRVQASGLIDLEYYNFQYPAPGLIFSEDESLFNPRLSIFLDAQIGQHVYFFSQVRADRGFDPSKESAETRLDEYAVRFTPFSHGDLHFQFGKFGTIAGNWVRRHASWENPFITAPLPYETLTALWDSVAAESTNQLLRWAHLRSRPVAGDEYEDKYRQLPIIWGPSYASGAALVIRRGKLDFAAEIKNASLSSRPETWTLRQRNFSNPTTSGRIGIRPNVSWNLGLSASSGSYLTLPSGRTPPANLKADDYRQTVIGQDISFAWRHLQIWSEFFAARFEIPRVTSINAYSWYLETKYKFTSQLFGALRWGFQRYDDVTDSLGNRTPWGRDTWRLDLAPTYRFNAHLQLKLQYSLQHEDNSPHEWRRLFAAQGTLRF